MLLLYAALIHLLTADTELCPEWCGNPEEKLTVWTDNPNVWRCELPSVQFTPCVNDALFNCQRLDDLGGDLYLMVFRSSPSVIGIDPNFLSKGRVDALSTHIVCRNGTWMLPEVDLPMTHVLCDQYIIDKQKALASPNKPISDSENATMVMDMSSASKDVQINQGTVESGVIKIEANSSTHTPVTPLADSSKAVTQPFTTTELVQSSSSSSMTTITLPEATTSRSEGSSFSTKEDHSSTKAVTEPTTNSTSVDLTKTTPVPSSTGTTSMKPENTITGDSSTTERAATNKIHDTKNSTTTVKPTTEISTKASSSAIVIPTPHSVTLPFHDMGKTTSTPILIFVPYDSEPAPIDQPKPKPHKKQPRRTSRAPPKKVIANLKQARPRTSSSNGRKDTDDSSSQSDKTA
ncbi:hypothetical protein Q1695_002522 [Nippostrongylus brasiliensis]|nr:hypothetical protein Q1695_002522 [Nippostrongylus brasiliensis]